MMKSVMLRLRSGASPQVLVDEIAWSINGWTVCYLLDDVWAQEVMIRTSEIIAIEKADKIYAKPKIHIEPGSRVDLEVVGGVVMAFPSDGGVGWAEEFQHQYRIWSIRGVGADITQLVHTA